jgi:hypothetical protein
VRNDGIAYKALGQLLPDRRTGRYQEMPLEKRLEWLYLGNLLRKIFCDEIDKMQDDLKAEQR